MMREAVVRVPVSGYPTSDLQGFSSLCREAGVSEWTPVVCDGPSVVVAIRVERPLDEARLSTFEYVTWWERYEMAVAGVGYLLKIDVPSLPDGVPSLHELQVSNEKITVHGHGLDISFVGDQSVLSNVVCEYTDAGIPMVLRTISDYRGPGGVLDSLTDRQREVVRTAFDMGYYEIPRRVRTEEVAAELGLEQSTVSEHLQRAECNLLGHVLGTD